MITTGKQKIKHILGMGGVDSITISIVDDDKYYVEVSTVGLGSDEPLRIVSKSLGRALDKIAQVITILEEVE
jgi:hypothetical protein